MFSTQFIYVSVFSQWNAGCLVVEEKQRIRLSSKKSIGKSFDGSVGSWMTLAERSDKTTKEEEEQEEDDEEDGETRRRGLSSSTEGLK